MILTGQTYRAERGETAETYQSFTVTMEMELDRRYIIVQVDNMTRWRSVHEYADYMQWISAEILKLPGGCDAA